jgi:hypothetical protein
MSDFLENLDAKTKEQTISIVSLYENFEFENELTEFLNSKGYDVTLDSSEIEAPENQTPRLIILVRKQKEA